MADFPRLIVCMSFGFAVVATIVAAYFAGRVHGAQDAAFSLAGRSSAGDDETESLPRKVDEVA